jgi:hypothetical protein
MKAKGKNKKNPVFTGENSIWWSRGEQF